MGSRKAQTVTYWAGKLNQVVCGCFSGTLDEFARRVDETHGDNEHGAAYRKYIRQVKELMKNA